MRDYAKVSPQFWTGETGKLIRSLGRDCQVIAFYLVTCPSSNMLGLYYLPLPTLCHETASPSKGALKALQRVSEGGFAHYHLPSETVFVPEMARFQIGERLLRKDNRHKAVVKELEGLRKSTFFRQFVEKYADPYELPVADLLKGLPSPSEGTTQAPSKPGAGTGTGERTGTRAGTGERERETRADARPATRLPENFELTPERRAVATAEGLDADRTFAKFVDYWRASSGSNARKLDWDATWRNWCRRENDSGRGPKPQRKFVAPPDEPELARA